MLREVFGLQAQLLAAAFLGIRARRPGAVAEEVQKALNQDRSIVRSWLFRGTIHLVAADDLRWLLSLLGPTFARGSSSRQAQLGLTDEIKLRGVRALREILAGAGPLTRAELVDALSVRGIILERGSQAPIHLIRLAALEGHLCLGPERGDGQQSYVLLDDWIPASKEISRGEALRRLAVRYFSAYGPATIEDLAAFSGLNLSDAGEAARLARSQLRQVTVGAEPAWMARRSEISELAGTPIAVRLLPAFDAYLLGYRRRHLAVPEALQARLQRGGGWIHPLMVVNGKGVASWTLKRTGKRAVIAVEPLTPIRSAVRNGLGLEVDDISRFLDLPITLELL